MVQTLKEEVRARIVAGAEVVFARDGYAGATMAAIAREAEISTGNVYRYFDSKDALFYAVFTPAFAEELMRLVRKRVAALVDLDDPRRLDDAARADAEAMLAFWIQHRLRVVVLLDRAAGSAYEGIANGSSNRKAGVLGFIDGLHAVLRDPDSGGESYPMARRRRQIPIPTPVLSGSGSKGLLRTTSQARRPPLRTPWSVVQSPAGGNRLRQRVVIGRISWALPCVGRAADGGVWTGGRTTGWPGRHGGCPGR